MTITPTEITALSHNHGPGLAQRAFSVAFDSSYAAGPGETLDLSSYFPNYVYAAWVISNAGGYRVELILGTLNSSADCKLIVYYQDCDAVSDSALVEVAGTTDLSTALAACRIMVQGC